MKFKVYEHITHGNWPALRDYDCHKCKLPFAHGEKAVIVDKDETEDYKAFHDTCISPQQIETLRGDQH